MLLTGTGLLIRSLQNSQSLDLGYDAKNVLDVYLIAPFRDDPFRQAAVSRRFAQRAEAIPGVQAIAMSDSAPLSGYHGKGVATEESQSAPNRRGLTAHLNSVSVNYFRTLGIPLSSGREFSDEEARTGARVAIVSERLARRLWPGENPLGKRFTDGDRLEVIGVVKDTISSSDLSISDTPQFYRPLTLGSAVGFSFLVRTDLTPAAVVPALRSLARDLDSSARIETRSLEQYLEQAIEPMRMGVALASALGVLALLLATVGTYGLASFNVSQQTQEFGIRLALGAQQREVIGLVLRQNFRQVALGMGIGLLLSAAISPLLTSFLVGLPPIDPVTFFGVSGLLTAVTGFACYLPARRAARVDPMMALRHE
jgi:putative ABC transport system permease protein